MTEPLAIDLNADLGEGQPWDEPLLERISSANVGCGAHAGDRDAIRRTLETALARGVVIGAHPGYPDREHFGRREMDLDEGPVEDMIVSQVEGLRSLAAPLGATVRYLKPHGALYNQAQRSGPHAVGVARAAARLGLPLLGQPGSLVAAEAARLGVPYIAEGFADRAYRPDGSLVPRSEPGAVLDDPARIESQLLDLVRAGFATICLHGDNAGAIELADLVRSVLAREGVAIRPFLATA
jgi:UPF0271 protein